MRRYLLWSGIVVLWITFFALAWFMSQDGNFGATDFRIYYQSARLLIDGQPLYHGTVGSALYLYPPLLAQMLVPLAYLPVDTAWLIWYLLNGVLLIGITAVLSRQTERPLWLWLITPIFLPVLAAAYIGQVTIILYVLLAGGWLAIKHERILLAGVLLALVTWIKIYPAVLIVYFVWKRDWRIVRASVIAGVLFGLLQLLISGLTPLIDMFGVFFSLAQNGQTPLVAVNASLNGFASQLFLSFPDTYPAVLPLIVSPVLYWISRAALTLGLVGGLLFVSARSDDFDLQYGLAIMTALLLSPTLFSSGIAPALLIYFLLLRRFPSKSMIYFCTLACVVLSAHWLYILGYSGGAPVSALVMSFGFYALIVTWAVNFFVLYRGTSVHQDASLVREMSL